MTKAEASPMLLCVVRRGQPPWEEAWAAAPGPWGPGSVTLPTAFEGNLLKDSWPYRSPPHRPTGIDYTPMCFS